MLTGERSTCCKVWYRIWCILATLFGLVAIAYGSYLLYNRSHVRCPVESFVSNRDFLDNSLHVYSSFCNASQPQTYPTSLNVPQWCQTLDCGAATDQWCLVYVTGNVNGSCPPQSGGCALSCFPSLHADRDAGIALVTLGAIFLTAQIICTCWRFKVLGEWW